jgi:hypothetical protein
LVSLIPIGLVLTIIPDGERANRFSLLLGKQGCIRAGVDASGKKDTDGNIPDLVKPDRGAELV